MALGPMGQKIGKAYSNYIMSGSHPKYQLLCVEQSWPSGIVCYWPYVHTEFGVAVGCGRSRFWCGRSRF